MTHDFGPRKKYPRPPPICRRYLKIIYGGSTNLQTAALPNSRYMCQYAVCEGTMAFGLNRCIRLRNWAGGRSATMSANICRDTATFSHVEHDEATMDNNLRADLDQLLALADALTLRGTRTSRDWRRPRSLQSRGAARYPVGDLYIYHGRIFTW